MKADILPALNLDAATRLVLPLEAVEARAQRRFLFRLPGGETEWLLARLCAIEADFNERRFMHCVVLRPENAEPGRLFVASNLWYRAGKRHLTDWMTPAEAAQFNWDLFERSFNDNAYVRRLSRYVKIEEPGRSTVLRFGADGWGGVVGFQTPDNNPVSQFGDEGFIWQRRSEPHEIADLRFLRLENSNFRRKVRALWRAPQGSIQQTLRWMQLSEDEKCALAFQCENGTWSQLQTVAALVLTVRLAHQKPRCKERCVWDFADYGAIWVEGNARLRNDDALFLWRSALTQVFATPNLGGEGVKIDSLPLCLWSYIGEAEQRNIAVSPPETDEIEAANRQLKVWTEANFTIEIGQVLLDSLAKYSAEEARKLREFFTKV